MYNGDIGQIYSDLSSPTTLNSYEIVLLKWECKYSKEDYYLTMT